MLPSAVTGLLPKVGTAGATAGAAPETDGTEAPPPPPGTGVLAIALTFLIPPAIAMAAAIAARIGDEGSPTMS